MALAFVLLLPSSGLAMTAEQRTEDGLCVHHPRHDETCGYAEAREGSPCTHEHDGACGYAPPTEGTPCTHVHDGACCYAAPAAEVPCDKGCTETGADGSVVHSPDCAFTPAAEGSPCTHEHGESCGYTAPSAGSPCTHVHDESCGYVEAVEGRPCGFVCDRCAAGWQWDDPDGVLVQDPNTGRWTLSLPGAGPAVTREELAELLPRTVTAVTAAGERTAELVWNLEIIPEGGASSGAYTLTAVLGGEFVLTGDAPALEVLLDLGGAELLDETRGHYPGPVTQVVLGAGGTTHKFVNDWSYVVPDGIKISHTNEYDYSTTLILPLSTLTNKADLVEAIQDGLPKKIYCAGGNSGNVLVLAGFDAESKPAQTGNIKGWVNLTWNLETAVDNYVSAHGYDMNQAELQLYADPVSNDGYQLRVNSNDSSYLDTSGTDRADTAEAYDILNLKVKLVQKRVVTAVATINGLHKYVSQWEYVPSGGMGEVAYDEKTDRYSARLDILDEQMTVEGIRNALPKQLTGSASYDQTLINAGFKNPSGTAGVVRGNVDLDWTGPYDSTGQLITDVGTLTDGSKLTFYAQPKTNPEHPDHRLRVNSNDPGYRDSNGHEADTLEAKDVINLTVTLRSYSLANHIVTPASPQNVNVNLFDYWVKTKEPTKATNGDILDKTDSHFHEDGDQGGMSESPSNYSSSDNWKIGINEGHLLLFGDGLIHAGLWNKGAGENCRYGKEYAGMEGIVRNTLPENGYPEMNLDNAGKILAAEKESPEWNEKYKTEKYKLVKDYALSGDHDSTAGNQYTSTDIQNLSKTVLNAWNPDGSKTTESLQYLFDPAVEHPNKTSYTGVKGLFQLDGDGYYYYDMRKNFAEFRKKENPESDNRFVLYDAPATIRTDGEKSVGNFFPFNTAAQVFDSVSEDRTKLSSTVACSNNEMNHHLGMTVNVDFRQPLDGRINTGSSNAQPMTFQFSGDDDVWVFIDDVLVLDMGGVHSEVYGIIDFATGTVLVGRGFGTKGIPAYDTENPEATQDLVTMTDLKTLYEAAGKTDVTKWTGNTFETNTTHTLKMFYLERGNYDSSLALRFNLQPMLYQQIRKVDQNGDPVENVQFKLYPAEITAAGADGAIECLYTDSDVEGNRPFFVRQTGTEPLVTLKTDADGRAQFHRDDGSLFSFSSQSTDYYILHEENAPAGYRRQPIDIVLHYDRKTAMLSVANRWTTGAYACSVAHVTGSFISGANSREENGLAVAVPLLKKGGQWHPLYGSNMEGFQMEPGTGEGDMLLAALKQLQGGYTDWHLSWDAPNSRLTGTLSDLPGLASRYTLMHTDGGGDLQVAYLLITKDALNALGINETTADTRYTALQDYLQSHTPEATCDGILDVASGCTRLNAGTFNRDFRSLIYIPNELRELRVMKVDEDGSPIAGVQFDLYDTAGASVAHGLTDDHGMLVFSPTAADDGTRGQARMVWAQSEPSDKVQYYLQETVPAPGYDQNRTRIPVVVGTYSIYADAGTAEDNVSVMAGVGRLTQTMRQFAMANDIDITLQDVTAIMQTQESGRFSLTGWKDAALKDTGDIEVTREMNLHYGINNTVGDGSLQLGDYGLHNEDGGAYFRPFFTTETGFIRARVEQMAAEDRAGYGTVGDAHLEANWDDLRGIHLTNLFSLLDVVVVTDRHDPEPADKTAQLTVSKTVKGEQLTEADYMKLYRFEVKLTDAGGTPLDGTYRYQFYGKDKWGEVKSGDTLLLHHDESVTILGLPDGTRFTVTELNPTAGWFVKPAGKEITGTADAEKPGEAAFINSTTEIKDPDKDPDGDDDDDDDKPDPGDDDKPDPKPGDDDKPDPKPGDDDKPDPKPGDDDKPDPKPGDDDKPDPKPGDEDKPDPKPGDDDKPDPKPSDDDKPDPKPGDEDEPDPGPGDEEDPDPKPGDPENPTENPGYPTELPDPKDPDSPDTVTIWEEGVPKTYVKWWDPEKEEWVYLPEDQIPLAAADPSEVPPTGDDSRLWLWTFTASLLGLAVLAVLRPFRRKGKREAR